MRNQLRFGGNWLHIIFWRIVYGGSSELAGTGSTLYSGGLFLKAAQIWQELAFFSGCNLINKGTGQKHS